MESENLDYESITEARRKAIEANITEVSVEKLKALAGEIFPSYDHPWRHLFESFIEENKDSTFYQGTTNDQVGIIYCPAREKGMWFLPQGGAGPLQARGLAIMKEIVENR